MKIDIKQYHEKPKLSIKIPRRAEIPQILILAANNRKYKFLIISLIEFMCNL